MSRAGLEVELRHVLAGFLRQANGPRMVSATDAIAHLRDRISFLTISDRHLADIVAGVAIVLGLDVRVDKASGRSALFDRGDRSLVIASCC